MDLVSLKNRSKFWAFIAKYYKRAAIGIALITLINFILSMWYVETLIPAILLVVLLMIIIHETI